MRVPGSRSISRFLLALMLATFLSPSLAWHMHAQHHEIAAEAKAGHGHDHDGDHHAASNGAGDAHASDAHASIGHLLGHLTMQMSKFVVTISPAEDVAPAVDVPAPLLVSETSPPFRPPLTVRLA